MAFLSSRFPFHLQNQKGMIERNGYRVLPIFFCFFCPTVLPIKEPLKPSFLNKPCLISCISSDISKWLAIKRRPLLPCPCSNFLLFQMEQVYVSQYTTLPWRAGNTSSPCSAPARQTLLISDGSFLGSVWPQQNRSLIMVMKFHSLAQLN